MEGPVGPGWGVSGGIPPVPEGHRRACLVGHPLTPTKHISTEPVQVRITGVRSAPSNKSPRQSRLSRARAINHTH